jgi:hypothetical protein
MISDKKIFIIAKNYLPQHEGQQCIYYIWIIIKMVLFNRREWEGGCWWPNLMKYCYIGYIRPSQDLALVSGQIYPIYGGHIQYIRHIWLLVRIKGLDTGSRLDISDPGQIYPMCQIYPTTGRVPEPWQPGPIGYIRLNQNQHSWI